MGGSFDSGEFHGTKGSPQMTLESADYAYVGSRAPIASDNAGVSSARPARESLMSQATTPEAKAVVNQLYRPGATVGDGGTADAIREELASGTVVGKHSHVKKGRERVRQLKRLLRRNPNHPDRALLEHLLEDLEDALGGK